MSKGYSRLISDDDARLFRETLQQFRISLMDNGELILVPGAVQCMDVVCILSGADSPCVLRLVREGNWALVSGDCYILTEEFGLRDSEGVFGCDEHVLRNQSRLEEFVLQ